MTSDLQTRRMGLDQDPGEYVNTRVQSIHSTGKKTFFAGPTPVPGNLDEAGFGYVLRQKVRLLVLRGSGLRWTTSNSTRPIHWAQLRLGAGW